MKNSLILLFKTLIFISVFNIANSMSCGDFYIKLNLLQDQFSNIFIMKYITENVIYTREKDNFYVYFTGYDIFLKFDKCIDKDATSHIILSNIFGNNKYRFNLNAKLETHSESFEIIVGDPSSMSDPNMVSLYNQFIFRYESIGVGREQLLAYLSYINANYGFLYFDSSDEDIKSFILNEKSASTDELTLYEYHDLHTDEDAQLTVQSKTTPLEVKVNKGEARGTKRSRKELDIDSSSDEGDSYEFGGSAIKDNSDIDSCKVNAPMEKDSEHGVLNSSIENSEVLKFKKITQDHFTEIERIFKNLEDGQSIIIKFEEGEVHRKRKYKELVFKVYTDPNGKIYYTIFFYPEEGGVIEMHHQLINFRLTPKVINLIYRESKRAVKGDHLCGTSKKSQPEEGNYVINGYALFLSGPNIEDKSKKVQEHEDEEHETQLLEELKEKYRQSFVSLIKEMKITDVAYLRVLLKRLDYNQTIVFITNNSKYRTVKYKEIGITKFNKNRYNITITEIEIDKTESFLYRSINPSVNDNSIYIRVSPPLKNKLIKEEKVSISNSSLYGPVMFKKFK